MIYQSQQNIQTASVVFLSDDEMNTGKHLHEVVLLMYWIGYREVLIFISGWARNVAFTFY